MNSPENHQQEELIEKHDFFNNFIFLLKTYLLTAKRYVRNRLSPLRHFKDTGDLLDAPIISSSESDLWNPHDNADNWILTAGKIQNLRIAARRINGLEIKAGEVFGFWRHIGNPNFGKGYVKGREVREGCVLPTVAGGLCQLSNALYDSALKANFHIVERHKHTRVIKGSLAEQDRDATVKWNYVDLRFKSDYDFRIEVELTADQLLIRFKSQGISERKNQPTTLEKESDSINDCYSCGNVSCFKHPRQEPKKQAAANTTYLLDEHWQEYNDYILATSSDNDFFIFSHSKNPFFKSNKHLWETRPSQRAEALLWNGLQRKIGMRRALARKENLFERSLFFDKKIALGMAKHIPLESTHLVISQNLLPFLFEANILGGRTFDVLMTRLPITALHERLDKAATLHPQSETLRDFRADANLARIENKALNQARKIITPHAGIARMFQHKAIKLAWHIPTSSDKVKIKNPNKILFPASAVARKGAYEIKRLAKEFGLEIVVTGKAIEREGFWEGLPVSAFDGNWEGIGIVVCPAYVEHQPRLLLKALSKGIPVIATEACGLNAEGNSLLIDTGNYQQLREAVEGCLTIAQNES